MSRKRLESHPHVAHVDDERNIDNGVIITLKEPYCFDSDPNCGVRGFDTFKEAWDDVNNGTYKP